MYLNYSNSLLFNNTTLIIVIQKKTSCQFDESNIANSTVTIKITNSNKMLKTIRFVRSPLKIHIFKNTYFSQQFFTCIYPKWTNIFNQLNTKFGIWEANPIYCIKLLAYVEVTLASVETSLKSTKYCKNRREVCAINETYFGRLILTLLAVMNIFQGIRVPRPWSKKIKYTIFILSLGVAKYLFPSFCTTYIKENIKMYIINII